MLVLCDCDFEILLYVIFVAFIYFIFFFTEAWKLY